MARGDIVVRLIGDTSNLERKFASVGSRMEKVGKRLSATGRTLTTGLTLPIVAVGGLALKSAIDFESAFAGVRKTVDATEGEFARMEQGIRNMAKTIPATTTELSQIAEAAGAMGIAKEDILSFTRTVADMAETTNLTAEQAATAFGQIGNVLKLSGGDFERLGSTIVDLGNKGASTESEITELMLRLAGTGSTVGLAADEIAGLAAAMANAGINAEAGGTAMSRVLQKIAEQVANGGPKLGAFAQVAGMTADTFAEKFKNEPVEAVAAFLEGLRTLRGEGGNVIGTLDKLGISEARQVDVLTRLAGSQKTVGETLKISGKAWGANTALTDEAAKRYKTTGARLEVLLNKLKDVGISLGEALMPFLESAVKAAEPIIRVVGTMARAFGRLPGPVRVVIVGFVALLAALGPVLVVAGSITSAIGALMPIISALSPILFVLKAAFIAVGRAALTLFMNPVGLAIGAVVIAAILLIKHWDKVKGFLLAVWNAIKKAASVVFGFVAKIAKSGLLGPIPFIITNWSKVRKFLGAAWDAIRRVAARVFTWLKNLFLNFTPVGRIIKHWDQIKGAMGRIWNTIREFFGRVLKKIKEAFLNFTPIGQIIKNWEKIVEFVKGLPARLARAGRGMWDFIKNTFRSAINWLIDKWNALEFKIPGFDPPGPGPKFKGITIGVPDIPRLHSGGVFRAPTPGGEGLALLRDREQVFTPEKIAAMSRNGGTTVSRREPVVVQNFNFTINLPTGVNPAAAGAEIVKVIKEYERRSGSGWRR